MGERGGDSPTALVVGAGDDAADALSDAGVAVAAEGRPAAALDRLDGPEVDCVVTAQSLPDGTGLDLAEAVRERDPDLPVVLYPREGTAALAAEASGIDGLRYLPRSADEEFERLVECVRDAAAAYDRRRRRRRDAWLFDQFLSEVPLSVFFKDDDCRYVRASDAMHEPSKDPIGKTELEIARDVERPYAETAYEADRRVIETGEPTIDREETLFAEVDDVETEHRRTTRIPLRDGDGEVVGLFGVQFDVTEERRRESELRRSRRRLERLAEFAAHDLRNPLNLASGYVEHAIDAGDDAALSDAADALDRLGAMIDQLCSSLRSDVPDPIGESVELAGIARDAWARVGADAATLSVEVDPAAVLRADRSQLSTFFEHLFENAVAHAGPEVAVRLRATDDGFVVDDDGPGIPAAERESVLEYGYTTAEGGTGIGLAAVAEVAERHGWTLSIDESPDGGTRFEVADCLLVRDPDPDPDGGGTAVPLDRQTDVGAATPPGSSRYLADRDEWAVRGGGRNVWHDTDECHLRYATVDGDARIVGRVADLDRVADYSKAALVVRSEAEAGATLGGIGLRADDQTEVLWREERGDRIRSSQLAVETAPPQWYRVDRFGDRITCYRSETGAKWEPVDQRTVDCDETVAVGLLVCSFDPRQCTTAVFDHVEVVDL